MFRSSSSSWVGRMLSRLKQERHAKSVQLYNTLVNRFSIGSKGEGGRSGESVKSTCEWFANMRMIRKYANGQPSARDPM